MSVIDKLLTEWAFRCKKGYPDMKNPEDMKILQELYNEYGIVIEDKKVMKEEELEEDFYLEEEENQKESPEESTVKKDEVPTKGSDYDEIIKYTLKGQIPQAEGTYDLPQTTGELKVDSRDLVTFKRLYGIAPHKKGGEVGSAGSKGSGHGEIAIYWLLKYQKSPYNVADSRGGSSADLIVSGKNISTAGVEVKSYKEGNTGMVIGRIGTYTPILIAMNTLFSVAALYQEFAETSRKKVPPNAINATVEDFKTANRILVELDGDKGFKELEKFKIPFIKSMFAQITKLKAEYGKEGVGTISANLLKALLLAKFKDKPLGSGTEGYILNVQPSGEIKCIHITLNKLEKLTSDQVLAAGTSISQGTLLFNKEIFN